MANYRQQTISGLGELTGCSDCYTALSLCFSSTSASDVCCNVVTPVTVFVPVGETFTTASNLYATTALSGGSLAQAGFYSDNGPCSQI